MFFSSCDSLVEDSLEFIQANRRSLCVCLGNRNCSACNAGESGLISWRGGSLMGFLELRKARGVYSRVTTGSPFETLVCSLKSGTCLGMRDNSGM